MFKKSKAIVSMIMVFSLMFATGCNSTTGPSSSAGQDGSSAEGNNEVIVAKMSHSSAVDSTYDVGAKYFADLVDEYTNGTVQIDVFPNAQLGSDRDALEGQRMGTVDISLPGASMLTMYEPSIGVFNLPFLFADKEEVYSTLDGEVGQEIFSSIETQGLRVLSTFESGFRQVSTVSTPVTSLSDVSGLKVRIPDGDAYLNTWEALGANPTVIAWNETFTALQTNVVEGVEVPITSFADAGLSEIAHHFSYINYMYDPVVLIVSQTFWDKLSTEQQEAVQKAATEASAYERQYNSDLEEELQTQLESEGVTFYNPDLSEFQAAVQSIYDEYEYQDELNAILDFLGRST